jgi:hypothetical protein
MQAFVLSEIKVDKRIESFGNFPGNGRVAAFVALVVAEVRKRGHLKPFYERAGIGRVLGPEMEKAIRDVEETVVWLV